MTARLAARTTSPPKLSRVNVVFLEQLSFFAALPRGRHYFPHTKWLPKITDYHDAAALNSGRFMVKVSIDFACLLLCLSPWTKTIIYN